MESLGLHIESTIYNSIISNLLSINLSNKNVKCLSLVLDFW